MFQTGFTSILQKENCMKTNDFSSSSQNSFNIEEKIEQVRLYAQSAEKQSRFEHSERTAKMCEILALRYGLDGRRAFLAGIGHDICKECPDPLMITLAVGDGLPVGALESKKTALLHGRAAAQLLKTGFFIQDDEVIEAVQNHTFGKKSMSDFAKLLFIADKIEPGREHMTPERLKSFEKFSLNELTFLIVQENIDYLQSKGKKVADVTFELYEYLKQLIKEESRRG